MIMPFQPTLLTCSCPVLAVTSSILEYQRGHPNVHPADDEFLNAPQSSRSLAEPSFSSNKIKLNKLNVLTYFLIYCVHIGSLMSIILRPTTGKILFGTMLFIECVCRVKNLCTSCAGEYWPAAPLRAYRFTNVYVYCRYSVSVIGSVTIIITITIKCISL
jgi:hypothetical protein